MENLNAYIFREKGIVGILKIIHKSYYARISNYLNLVKLKFRRTHVFTASDTC